MSEDSLLEADEKSKQKKKHFEKEISGLSTEFEMFMKNRIHGRPISIVG